MVDLRLRPYLCVPTGAVCLFSGPMPPRDEYLPLFAIDADTREPLILLKQFLIYGGELTPEGAEKMLAMAERLLSGEA